MGATSTANPMPGLRAGGREGEGKAGGKGEGEGEGEESEGWLK